LAKLAAQNMALKEEQDVECLILRCAYDVLAHGKIGSCPPILSTQSDGP
jgi:hypothetical protein